MCVMVFLVMNKNVFWTMDVMLVAYDGEETALRIAVDKAIHIEKQKGF